MLCPTQQLPADFLTAWICKLAAVEWGKAFKWSQKIQCTEKGARSLENLYVPGSCFKILRSCDKCYSDILIFTAYQAKAQLQQACVIQSFVSIQAKRKQFHLESPMLTIKQSRLDPNPTLKITVIVFFSYKCRITRFMNAGCRLELERALIFEPKVSLKF